MRWSSKVCAALQEPHPMSPLQVSKKSIRGLVPLFRKLLTKVHMHPLHQVAFERVIEIGGLPFPRF
ncbi:hypothetical protein BMW24_022900 [Mycobacterium heckeshornense]|nr:hypothetical protein BMW24_022900 [Mycobacterium heckeshornense]